jgi:hypothetical protein
MILSGGDGSYREKDFDQERAFVLGLSGIMPKPLEWTEKAGDLLDISYDDTKALVKEFDSSDTFEMDG